MKLTTEATLSKDKATNTMLVTTIRIYDTVQLKMCQKYFPDSNALYAVYASAQVYIKMRVKVP